MPERLEARLLRLRAIQIHVYFTLVCFSCTVKYRGVPASRYFCDGILSLGIPRITTLGAYLPL